MLVEKSWKTRIYLNQNLALNEIIELREYHHNYLIKVLRQQLNYSLRVYNEKDGEWLSQIIEVNKKSLKIKLISQLRITQHDQMDLTLFFSPVKNPNANFYTQKATELGATCITPLVTKLTIVRDVNIKKIEQTAIEASEQCERLSVPQIHNPISLNAFDPTKFSGKIFYCDEKETTTNYLDVLSSHIFGNDAIIIGPEGGFNADERELIRSWPNTIAVSLGRNILRAETAMVTALSAYMLSFSKRII